jgi:hypothetical protein
VGSEPADGVPFGSDPTVVNWSCWFIVWSVVDRLRQP